MCHIQLTDCDWVIRASKLNRNIINENGDKVSLKDALDIEPTTDSQTEEEGSTEEEKIAPVKTAKTKRPMTDEEVNEQQEFVKNYQMPVLRPLDFVYEGEPEEIIHETEELIAVCPMTGLPDFYSLQISYIPDVP